MSIKTAIIPAAGLGTRMLPFSKEVPKEMLPLVIRRGRDVLVVPVLHYIFDALYEAGVRKFYFVVGRGKRVIEDYFTPDKGFVEYLEKKGKHRLAEILNDFYEKLDMCDVLMVNQPEPKGFGDAVLRTEPFMIDDVFIVHAGDDIIYPDHAQEITRLIKHYERYSPKALFLYDTSPYPERYGVIIGDDRQGYLEVYDIVEKPSKPPSNNVVVAVYIFDKDIYDALTRTKPVSGEHQLTDAIRYLLKRGETIHALKVTGKRLDLGTPDNYLEALKYIVGNIGGKD